MGYIHHLCDLLCHSLPLHWSSDVSWGGGRGVRGLKLSSVIFRFRVFLMDKYFVTSSQANLLNSLVYLISAAASPFIGILVDRTGFNLFWCMY